MRTGMLAQLLSFADGYRQAGVSRYIEYLLRYLPDELDPGDSLTVYAGNSAAAGSRVAELPNSLDWNWTSWPVGRVPIRILWEQLAAPVVTARARLDLIHGPVNVVPLAGRTRSVVTIHDLAFLAYPDQYPAMQRRYLSAMTRASTRKASRVIAVSRFTADDVAERLGVAPEKVVAISNGVSSEFYSRRESIELETFRLENRLPQDFLLFLGTLQPRKNLVGLLRAFSAVPEDQRLPLYVVGGEGWMYEPIFVEVTRLGISDDVHFAGYAASESLPLWYSAATAFIYPSYYEGFGLPVLEAMACGTPVITSNRTSLPEVAGEAGLIVNPDDPEDIAAAIVRVLDDASWRREVSALGIERASTFTWKRTARETAAVYRDVVNDG